MSTQEITKAQPSALRVASDSPIVMEGIDASVIKVPYASLCQGSNKEAENFPSVKRGDIYSKLLGEKIENPRFIVAKVWRDWEKHDDDNNLIYRETDINRVPEADREWTDGENGKRVPPTATERLNFVLIFDGLPVAHVFTFKSTSHNAGRDLATYSQALPDRACMFAPPISKNNNKGDKYLVPVVRVAPEMPTPEMLELRARFNASASHVIIDDEDHAEEVGDEPAPF